jgi:prepilin signal peptidase PulO-like enzyme (type II secretory pathway)
MIPLLIIFGIIPKYKKIIGFMLIIIGLFVSPMELIRNTTTTFIFIVLIYGTLKLMLSLSPLLQTTVKIKDLKEGMIPSKTLYLEKGKIKEYSFSIRNLIEDVKKGKLKNSIKPKNEIISSMKARGLIEEEIKELKKLYKNKKIGETIKIKDSMPFVPTMLIGYLLCIILGDFWILLW